MLCAECHRPVWGYRYLSGIYWSQSKTQFIFIILFVDTGDVNNFEDAVNLCTQQSTKVQPTCRNMAGSLRGEKLAAMKGENEYKSYKPTPHHFRVSLLLSHHSLQRWSLHHGITLWKNELCRPFLFLVLSVIFSVIVEVTEFNFFSVNVLFFLPPWWLFSNEQIIMPLWYVTWVSSKCRVTLSEECLFASAPAINWTLLQLCLFYHCQWYWLIEWVFSFVDIRRRVIVKGLCCSLKSVSNVGFLTFFIGRAMSQWAKRIALGIWISLVDVTSTSRRRRPISRQQNLMKRKLSSAS